MTTDLLPEKSPAMRMPGVPVRGLLARGLLWLMLASALAWAGTVVAAVPAKPAMPSTAGPAPETTASAPVRVWNRDLVTLNTPYRGVTPQMRAKLASERIAESIDQIDPNDLRADWAQVGSDTGVLFTSGTQLLFALRPAMPARWTGRNWSVWLPRCWSVSGRSCGNERAHGAPPK